MNPEDRSHSLAARIADGSGIDWAAAESASATPEDQALLRELRAISDVATLHRAPDVSSHQAETTLTSWGPLTILSPIGTGRFGEVHLAWDARLHRRVALKLHHVTSSSLASPTRAIDEARLLARIRHPSVLTVHGAEVVNEQVGIWTEFIEGQTLEALLAERGPLEPDEVIAIGIDLCRALAAVHDAGLLHRDIKAQNVMRETGGRIVLMDFGASHDLALAPARDGDLTGTPLYLAPEVLAGGAASRASDVYALGVLLFHLLTGTHPVTGKTLDDVRRGHERGERARLRDLRPELAPDLVEAVERALTASPSDRFSDASAFAAALERLRIGADRIEEDVRATRHGRRRLWASLAAVAAVATIVLVAYSLRPAKPGRPGGTDDELRMPIGAATSAAVAKISVLDGQAMIGRPSRDGRFLPYIDSVDVWFWNIGLDTTHKVTSLAGSGDSAQFPLMSPDGSRVIYVHYRADLKGSELRIVNADGSEPRTLIPVDQASSPEPLEWSRDGREILCTVLQSDGSTRLMLVGDRGGARTLQTFLQGTPRHASMSPDATLVVYDLPRTTDLNRRDVLIARTDRPVAGRILLEGSASNLMPIWTPDGHGVFFVSDRSGSMDGWVVPVTGGVAVGEPVRVASNLNRASPLGLTDDGQCYFALRTRKHDVYTVDIDGGVAHPATRARVSPTARGGHIAPGWSPRGDFMSYLTTTFNAAINDDSHVLTIQELATGQTHELPVDLAHLGVMAPRWSPDGRSLLIRGRSTEARTGFFTVDLTSRTVTPIVEFDSRVTAQFGAFAWAPDSQHIFYLDRQRGIVAADLGGRDDVVVPKSARPVGHSLVVSPDGRRLAFDSGGWIEIADINTGERHAPLPMNEGVRAIVQAWAPDGRILYTAITRGSDLPPRLWSVAESGGAPLDMGLTLSTDTQQNKLALSPDGRRLAFTEGVIGRELWMMDRFLPGARGNIPQK